MTLIKTTLTYHKDHNLIPTELSDIWVCSYRKWFRNMQLDFTYDPIKHI